MNRQLIIALLLALPAATQAAEGGSVSFDGDFRLRNEHIEDYQSTGAIITTQQQIRARASVHAKISEDLRSEIRLATGTGRTNTNQTLGGGRSGFGALGFSLDRGYLKWEMIPDAFLWGGRMANPEYLPGDSDLMWDSDLNFDGTALTAEQSMGDATIFETASMNWVSKAPSNPGRDILLGTFQLGAKQSVGATRFSIGASYHSYSNLVYAAAIPTFSGNSDLGGTYQYDFRILGLGADVTLPLAHRPLVFMVDFSQNAAAPTNNTAYLAGVRYGNNTEAHDWQLAYDYRILKKDSLVGAFSDTDSFGGGTDGFSHRITVAYRPRKNISVMFYAMIGKKSIAAGETPTAYDKALLDFQADF